MTWISRRETGYDPHRLSPSENVLVEEKVGGQEFSVEALVQHGRPVCASVTAKETTESVLSSFVELSHSVPCASAPATSALLEANCEVLERLGFEDGSRTRKRLTADDHPRLMKASRPPATARRPGRFHHGWSARRLPSLALPALSSAVVDGLHLIAA
ncbi:ATP-grasp domain-containing protein [Streptomyces sp. NPDC048581]|uniref:ATP-grasp domain-containing protein n=1 Tax=Streptomyces sp. NPDC048581 TaxID=3365572 RepID=UPI00371A6D3B